MVIGVTLGVTAAFFGGWVDSFIGRLMDIFLAFPLLVFAIALAGVIPNSAFGLSGDSLKIGVLVFIIGFFSWPYIGRIIRGQALSLREREFIDAARSLGAGSGYILRREMLPNLIAPILVYSTLLIPTNILFEAALALPRRRHPAAHPDVGRHAQRRRGLVPDRPVVHGAARIGHLLHRARLQPLRRRPARRPRPPDPLTGIRTHHPLLGEWEAPNEKNANCGGAGRGRRGQSRPRGVRRRRFGRQRRHRPRARPRGRRAAGFNAGVGNVFNASTTKGGTLKMAISDDWDSLDPGDTYYGFAWDFARFYGRALTTFNAAPGKDGREARSRSGAEPGPAQRRRQDLDVQAEAGV